MDRGCEWRTDCMTGAISNGLEGGITMFGLKVGGV